jgi:hypothetical protein
MALVEVMDVARDVAQQVKRCPTGTLVAAYVRAARAFCGETRWYRSGLPGLTTADVRSYSMGSDPFEEVIGIRSMSALKEGGKPGGAWPVVVSDSTGWAPAQSGAPRRYCYVPEGQFALDPVPDGIYELDVTIILQPRLGQNKVAEVLLTRWDRAFFHGALAYLLTLNEPWKDANMAIVHGKAFQAQINNARAAEQRAYNAGSVRARPRQIIA